MRLILAFSFYSYNHFYAAVIHIFYYASPLFSNLRHFFLLINALDIVILALASFFYETSIKTILKVRESIAFSYDSRRLIHFEARANFIRQIYKNNDIVLYVELYTDVVNFPITYLHGITKKRSIRTLSYFFDARLISRELKSTSSKYKAYFVVPFIFPS
jgi:hypothetical protein